MSILAEPPVSLVDKVADKHRTRPVAQAYLDYLYRGRSGDRRQNFYRPRNGQVAAKYSSQFVKVDLFSIDEFWRLAKSPKNPFCRWDLDQIYQPSR